MTDTAKAQPTRGPRLGLLLITLAVLIAIAWQVHMARRGGDDRVPWRDDYADALNAAQSTGKPILANFTADWCPGCQEMNRHVFSRPEVAQAIDDGFVPLRIDLTRPDRQQQSLAMRYAVMATPMLMILDDHGKPLSIAAGFVDPQTLLAWLGKHGKAPAEAVGSTQIREPEPPGNLP